MAEAAATPSFDPDALREKYRQERDKRLRKDGNAQYLEVVDEFAHFLEDPYVKPIERAALHDDVEVLVIGGGFAGLLIGARLREGGVRRHSHRGKRRRLRRHLVLEPLSRRRVRHRGLHLSAAARRNGLHPDRESTRRRRKFSRTAGASQSTTTCIATCCSRRRSPNCVGTKRRRAGSCPPIAATASRRNTSAWRTAR